MMVDAVLQPILVVYVLVTLGILWPRQYIALFPVTVWLVYIAALTERGMDPNTAKALGLAFIVLGVALIVIGLANMQ